MPGKPRISIVGPGNLGRSLALPLFRAGYVIDRIVFLDSGKSSSPPQSLATRVGARASRATGAALDADLIWLTVPDRAIAPCAQKLARRGNWSGRVVLHSSGALASDELRAFKTKGAAIASL